MKIIFILLQHNVGLLAAVISEVVNLNWFFRGSYICIYKLVEMLRTLHAINLLRKYVNVTRQ